MAKEYLMVNGKLVLVDNQLVQLPNETEYSNALDGEIISLASTEELTNDIMTQLKGYVNGSPKRVFDNLTTLRNTHPNGAIGTYLCKDNKHFYIWNGSIWQDCGLYLTNPLEPSVLPNGTVVSNNADFAEVGKGDIGDGYFVTTIGYDSNYNVPIIAKANSTSDIRGVTVSNPAFCAGIKSNFLDHDELRQGFAFVGFAGIVNVIDNGKCTVNGNLVSRCMSADDGTAKPSSNNMGYQIISRVDSKTIRIVVEPSADMIQRIKVDITNLMVQTGVGDGLIWNDGNDRIHYYATAVEDTEIANKNYVDTKTYGYTHSNGQIDISTESGGVNIGSVQGNIDITSDGGAVNITASNSESVNITSTNDCVYIDARVDVNLIGDAIYLTSENVELNSDYTPSAKNSVVNKGYVDDNFATEHEAHSLRKEILDLKEEIYGTILDVTTIDVADNGTIPSVVNVEGTDYNVLPKGDVSVVNVYGDTTRCVNLLKLNDVPSTTTNGITYSVKDGVITLNGTASDHLTVFLLQNKKVPNGQYNLAYFSSGSVQANDYSYIQVAFQTNNIYNNYLDLPQPRPINLAQDETNLYIALTIQMNQVLSAVKIKPMLVKGTEAPTQFQPYFDGLKHTEYKNVVVGSPNLLPMTDKSFDSKGLNVVIEKGVIKITGSNTSLNSVITRIPIPVTANTNYCWSPFIEGLQADEVRCFMLTDGNSFSSGVRENVVFNSGDCTLLTLVLVTSVSFISNTNVTLKPMLVRGTTSPTEFVPYYQSSILQTHTTLQGVEGYRDTLEVRLNEVTELYDVYKVTKCKTVTFNGKASENWGMQDTVSDAWRFQWNGTVLGAKNNRPNNDDVISVSSYEDVSANQGWVGRNGVSFDAGGTLFVTNLNTPSIDSFRSWLSSNPLTVTYALATPIETKIASNLTFDQVTALVHTLSNVKIVNPNDIYLNKPKVNLGLVYKKVIS